MESSESIPSTSGPSTSSDPLSPFLSTLKISNPSTSSGTKNPVPMKPKASIWPIQKPLNPSDSELLDEKILKSIFKHMRVNTRLQLSQHIPAIREIEASVPLSAERFILNTPSEFIVDNTIFHINYCSESEYFAEDPKQDESEAEVSPWMVCAMKSKRYSRMEKIMKPLATPTEATEYLVTKFFGGRPSPIVVKYLGLEHKGPFLGFPKDMIFKIKDLKITHDCSACIDSILPFVDPSSFPLATVFIKGTRTKTSGKYDHPIIETAQYLHILDHAGSKYWSKKLHELKNTQVHLQCPDVRVDEFLWILEMHIKTAKPPGTWISVGMDRFKDIKDVMTGVRKIPMAKVETSGTPCSTFTEAIVLPITPIREMGVYVSQNQNLATHDRMFSQFDINLCIFAVPLPPGVILKSSLKNLPLATQKYLEKTCTEITTLDQFEDMTAKLAAKNAAKNSAKKSVEDPAKPSEPEAKK